MELKLRFPTFQRKVEDLRFTLNEIETILPFENLQKGNSAREAEILQIYEELINKSKVESIADHFVERICEHLDKMYRLFIEHSSSIAKTLIELRLSWDSQSPHGWYELGKIYYQQFISRESDDEETTIHIFQHVIELVEKFDKYHDMGFWAYSYMANLYLYRILSGEEALVHAMKNYNMAYRFSQTYEITAHEDFIFDDLEILQNILMNQYPLLVLFYNSSGVSLYEYLFQFVEVITQEQRFIPNFTALMSVVDERMNEIFNSTISSAYLILQNRLMVMNTLYDEDKKSWIKIAFIFSYLQQSDEDIEINQDILTRVKLMKHRLLEQEDIMRHLKTFNGRHDWKINQRIEELLQEVFSNDVMPD